MGGKYKRKKRNFLLNHELQGKFILKTFMIFILSAVGFTLFLGLITLNTQTMVYEGYQLKIGATPLILWKQMLYSNWIFIVLGGVVLIIVSTLLTHRIAGPLFRFEKCINNMMQGDLTDRIYLRDKDEGVQLSNKINAFNKNLSTKINRIRTISDLLKEETDQKKSECATLSEKPTCKNHFDQIVQYQIELKQLLDEFKTLNDE